MASRQDGVTQLYDLPQGGGPERLPQPEDWRRSFPESSTSTI